MIRWEEKLVITFRTTTEAMAMEHICKAAGAPGRLIPVPKEITAGCGMAWCAGPETEAVLREVMERNGVSPQEVRRCLV